MHEVPNSHITSSHSRRFDHKNADHTSGSMLNEANASTFLQSEVNKGKKERKKKKVHHEVMRKTVLM